MRLRKNSVTDDDNFKKKNDNITRDSFTLRGINDKDGFKILVIDQSENGYIDFDDLRYHNTDPKVSCKGKAI